MMVDYAYCVLKDHHLSEEAVQETFRIACGPEKIDSIYKSPNPKGWLINTLKNVIRNIEKNRQVLSKYFIKTVEINDLKIKSYDEHSLKSLFGSIADSDDFKLVERIVLYKLTILEAATELGISVDTCKKRVQRAKKRLRKMLE